MSRERGHGPEPQRDRIGCRRPSRKGPSLWSDDEGHSGGWIDPLGGISEELDRPYVNVVVGDLPSF
jgi:hypothetical protein